MVLILTQTQLENAALDALSLEQFINQSSGNVTTRLGSVYPALQQVITNVSAAIAANVAAGRLASYTVLTGGSVDYVATPSPAVTSLSGLNIVVKINVANTTTSPTLNTSALGAKPMKPSISGSYAVGELAVGSIKHYIFDTTADAYIEVSASFADNSVSTAKIINGAISAAKLATSSVGSSAIADGAVTEAKIASNSIANAMIKADAISTSKIGDGQVTVAKTSGFGSMATQNSNAVNITGGTIAGTLSGDGAGITGLAIDSYLGVGAYTLASIANGTTVTASVGAGGTIAGSSLTQVSLSYSSGSSTMSFRASGATLSGTWKNMGHSIGAASRTEGSLFMRIA